MMNKILKTYLLVLFVLPFLVCGSDLDRLYENLPFEMVKLSEPQIPDYEVNITDFGAVPGGATLNTQAIDTAMKSVSEKGGGKIIF